MQYNFPCERKIIILGHHLQKREMQNYSEFEVYLWIDKFESMFARND